MFSNYLKIIIRIINRQKMYSVLNILGLTTGLTCFILIALFVNYEFSYDSFHENKENIYRVINHKPGSAYMGNDKFAVTQAPLAMTLMNEFQEVKKATVINSTGNTVIEHGAVNGLAKGLNAWENFFDVFSFNLKKGDKRIVLADPFSILFTESLAKKYFGRDDPIGKTVLLKEKFTFTVTGICADVPKNSHIQFDFIIPFLTYLTELTNHKNPMENWGNSSYYTYFTLNDKINYKDFEKKLSIIKKKHVRKKKDKKNDFYVVQPLLDIHLRSNTNFEMSANGDIKTVNLFIAIACIVLFIACINFMNLSTARSSKRAKEIGIRKTAGAWKGQLIRQFIGESIFYSFLSICLAMIIVILTLPIFNIFINRPLEINLLFTPLFILTLVCSVLFTGILSGSYPALVLSGFQPAIVLKGKFDHGKKGNRLRNILVVFQFSISIILIAGTLTIQKQLHYIKTKKLGYSREQIVCMRIQDKKIRGKYDIIKDKFLKHPSVAGVTTGNYLPTRIGSRTSVTVQTDSKRKLRLKTYLGRIDYGYLDVFDIKLKSGRDFSSNFSTDAKAAVLINEAAVKAIGWKNPIGKEYSFSKNDAAKVIGVIEDFHFRPLHLGIEPMAFVLRPNSGVYLIVKLKSGDISGAKEFFRDTFESYDSKYPFEFSFVDDIFNKMYKSEEQLGNIFGVFSGLAIFIACLGLFGLSAYTAERRTKEIGIRKTLGASVPDVILLISKDFTFYIILSNIIALPAAYFAMTAWLQNFAFSISVGTSVLGLSAACSIIIALLTVSFQAAKAATANPAKALRYE